jgi:N6-adenosine-specific RNA methylase IME4
LRGRSDQRFCSDYCRNHYHNRKKQKERSFFRKINQILHRNRMILYQLANNYQIRISCEELRTFGFNFDYCTAWEQNENQEPLVICYDMAYRRSKEEVIIFRYGRTIPLSNDS